MIKIVKDFQWKHFLVSCIIVSIGAFFIHSRYNSPINFQAFFSWLPVSWLLVFVMAVGFTFFIGGED